MVRVQTNAEKQLEFKSGISSTEIAIQSNTVYDRTFKGGKLSHFGSIITKIVNVFPLVHI